MSILKKLFGADSTPPDTPVHRKLDSIFCQLKTQRSMTDVGAYFLILGVRMSEVDPDAISEALSQRNMVRKLQDLEKVYDKRARA